MNKEEKEGLRHLVDKFTEDFWSTDCLIRMMKEILTNNNWETREEDVYYISKILTQTSNALAEQVKILQLQLEKLQNL